MAGRNTSGKPLPIVNNMWMPISHITETERNGNGKNAKGIPGDRMWYLR